MGMFDKKKIAARIAMGFRPHAFRKEYPDLLIHLGFDPNDHRAAFVQPLYDWLYGAKTCEFCHSAVKFEGITRGYRRFCSRSCSAKDPALKKQRTARTDEQKADRKQKVKNAWENKSLADRNHIRTNRIAAHAQRGPVAEAARRTKIAAHWANLSEEHSADIKAKRLSAKLSTMVKIASGSAEELNVEPMFDWNDFQGKTREYPWRCKVCATEFNDWMVHVHPEQIKRPRCPTCFPITHGVSLEEQKLVEWVRSVTDEPLELNNRRRIGRELDIYIASLNLGIEYNGSYWHSEEIVGKTAAWDKLALATNNGLRLVTVMDFEWTKRTSAVKNRLLHLLGASRKVSARDCEIVDLSAAESRLFLETHHTQGDVGAEVRLALRHAGEVIALMTFGKPRFNKANGWELLRYAASASVVGGASKLFQHFIREFRPWRVISYADRRWSDEGKLYKVLGFSQMEVTSPGYFYTKGRDVKTRVQCQKHRLVAQGHDPNQTEYQIMRSLGWLRVWDCGHHKFVWEP